MTLTTTAPAARTTGEPTDGPVHLIIGPDQHGVVRHAVHVARACEHSIVRHRHASDVTSPVAADVVHLPFTDRLLGPDLVTARAQFQRLAAAVRKSGAALSVTLHDLPHDDSPYQLRRWDFYDAVIAEARGVVVNSAVELSLVQDRAASVHSLRLIRLPIHPPALPPEGPTVRDDRTVAVLGYIYPDRGYEYVLAALPHDSALVALGRPADGHEHLADTLRATERFSVTGYLPDDQLSRRLRMATVPIAPNPRITASASINSWLAHGRRPLVPDSPYARELLAERPDGLHLYDERDPGQLRALITRALDDPSFTRLPGDAPPDVHDVAERYRDHLAACRPPTLLATRAGLTVPGNRFDLLPSPTDTATVTVVIPYYDDQRNLDRLLAALDRQTHERFDVVVVDDGSPSAPDVGGRAVRVLRQPDRGFRAARARNLGAHAATGDVLVFLDGDTIPEPDFVRQLASAAAVADTVAVGRRRHAELDDDGIPAVVLDEPGWLREAYLRSHDLLDADRRSYRFVISAVLGVRRELFLRLGGFDERFASYGGEDWEFAHRAWVDGALLRHVPDAVAWHDGPDWSQRGDAASRAEAKARERATLAELLPDPDERELGGYPSVVVHAGGLAADEAAAVARSADGVDCAVFTNDEPPPDVLARAWCQVWVHAPCDLAGLLPLAGLASAHGTVRTPQMTLVSTRALNRARRHADGGDVRAVAERLFGRHDRTV